MKVVHTLQNSPKNLDLSNKTDLDFSVCVCVFGVFLFVWVFFEEKNYLKVK